MEDEIEESKQEYYSKEPEQNDLQEMESQLKSMLGFFAKWSF